MTTKNTIHWATSKTVKTVQGSWGDTAFTQVQITTDLTDPKEITTRFMKALRLDRPFNPTCCTNQHQAVTLISLENGQGVVEFETYHSIGD